MISHDLIDRPDEAARQQLLAQLHQDALRAGCSSIHALLDTALSDAVIEQQLSELNAKRTRLFEGHYAMAGMESVDPQLLELSIDAEGDILRLCEACAGRPMLSFIVFPGQAQTLLGHLRRHLEARDDQGTQLLLRWTDTRCLPSLLNILHPQQRSCLLQGIHAWFYFGRDGQPQRIVDESQASHPASTASADIPYRLLDEQVQALVQSGRPDALLAFISAHPQHYEQPIGPPSRRYQLVRQALDQLPAQVSDAQALRNIAKALDEQGMFDGFRKKS